MKPQKRGKRAASSARAPKKRGEPQFDHKSEGVSRLPYLLTDWFGAHNAEAGMDAVSSGQNGRFAPRSLSAAKGRQ
jgi:hypothetical protein